MKKSTISLVAILALALAIPAVRAPALIRADPISPPGTCCAPSGALEVNLNAPGTFTVSVNFTINVPKNTPAFNIQALFILNHTNPSTLGSAPTMVETGMGSSVAGVAGTPLVRQGPWTNTFWAYSTAIAGGVGPDCVFPDSPCTNGTPTSYYNFSFIWTSLVGPSNGFSFWKVLNVTFTVVSVPAHYIIVGAGNANSATDFTGAYATPWSGATNINVIPEFLIGTIVAVVVPLLALAGYMRYRSSKNGPIASLATQ